MTIRLCSLLLILGGCSLAVSDIPDGGSFTGQADAQATTPQRPIPDVGPSNPNEDATNPSMQGHAVRCRPAVRSSGSMKTATCASRLAEQRQSVETQRRCAEIMLGMRSRCCMRRQAAGDGSSDAGNAGSLEAMIAAGAEATAGSLRPEPTRSDPPIAAGDLVGPCVADHRAGGAHDHQRLSALRPGGARFAQRRRRRIAGDHRLRKRHSSWSRARPGASKVMASTGAGTAVISGVTFGAVPARQTWARGRSVSVNMVYHGGDG